MEAILDRREEEGGYLRSEGRGRRLSKIGGSRKEAM